MIYIVYLCKLQTGLRVIHAINQRINYLYSLFAINVLLSLQT